MIDQVSGVLGATFGDMDSHTKALEDTECAHIYVSMANGGMAH